MGEGFQGMAYFRGKVDGLRLAFVSDEDIRTGTVLDALLSDLETVCEYAESLERQEEPFDPAEFAREATAEPELQDHDPQDQEPSEDAETAQERDGNRTASPARRGSTRRTRPRPSPPARRRR